MLLGGDNDDTLLGGSGGDVLNGGNGIDTASYVGASGLVLDRVTPGNSTGHAAGDSFVSIEKFLLTGSADQFVGNGDDETVDGGGGNDTLNGGGGADILYGGAGKDTLTGGAGADIFDYNATSETAVGANADQITDFVSGSDLIDVSGMDARTNVSGNQAFTFIGAAAFSNVSGQLRAVASGSTTTISGDTNGDGTADFQIVLQSAVTLSDADFVL